MGSIRFVANSYRLYLVFLCPRGHSPHAYFSFPSISLGNERRHHYIVGLPSFSPLPLLDVCPILPPFLLPLFPLSLSPSPSLGPTSAFSPLSHADRRRRMRSLNPILPLLLRVARPSLPFSQAVSGPGALESRRGGAGKGREEGVGGNFHPNFPDGCCVKKGKGR